MLLAYLGAVANEFICSQWEQKGNITDVYLFISIFIAIWDQRQISFILL